MTSCWTPTAPALAFTVEDIHNEFKRLSAHGVKFKAEKPVAIQQGFNKGSYSICFTDPDGITFELLQPPPE